jgi:hypothetical protein
MITTKAVMDSLPEHADVESLAVLSRFWLEFPACLTARGDELFELADAVLCADGPAKALAGRRWPRSTGTAQEGSRRGRRCLAREELDSVATVARRPRKLWP